MDKKRGFRLLFAADLHGNISQYTRVFRFASANKYDALVLGGDLCTKSVFAGSMDAQRDFLKTYLIPKLKEIKSSANAPKVYIIPGNDDWAGNMDVLVDNDGTALNLIQNWRASLNQDFDIIGYPYIPLTPFRNKDWEKWDLASLNDIELARAVLQHGVTTWGQRYEPKRFNPEDRHNCIENDMNELFIKTNPKKTIFVFHAPPFNTNLDMLYSRDHIGSLGIRMAIERNQPFLTLHAHIHETVDVSGEFIDKINNTICAAVGNHNNEERPHVLEIILPQAEIRRIRLE